MAIDVNDPLWMNYKSGVYNGQCSSNARDVDHAVVVVGYGVDAATNLPYWLIR